MNWRGVLAVISLVFAAALAAAQDSFPDLPNHHWVFVDLQRLKKDGLLVGLPDGLVYHSRPPSRYELAVAVHVCYSNLRTVEAELENQAKQLRVSPVSEESKKIDKDLEAQVKLLHRNVKVWQPALTRLIKEFRPELDKLGADPAGMQHTLQWTCSDILRCQIREPGSSLVQFSDVPQDHWAAKQVLELRRLGILDGYPSGS